MSPIWRVGTRSMGRRVSVGRGSSKSSSLQHKLLRTRAGRVASYPCRRLHIHPPGAYNIMDGRAASTPTPGPDQRILRFGMFELDLRTGELRKGGLLVKLQQQPFKVLSLLAAQAGELVTRDDLRREIWGGDAYVDFDQGLNFCIKQIRSALGDQADAPR